MRWIALVALATVGSTVGGADLVGLAIEKRWGRIVEEAGRRWEAGSPTPPLSAREALVAGFAASQLGLSSVATGYLEHAVGEGPIADVARAELGLRLAPTAPERAVELVLELLSRPATGELRETAVETTVIALHHDLDPAARRSVRRRLSRLPRSDRRRIEVALALTGPTSPRRHALAAVLEQSSRDQAALDAALALASDRQLSGDLRWWIGRALYRHALYELAEPHLAAAAAVDDRSVPRWEAAFQRGRCAFRRGRYDEAGEWYAESLRLAHGRERRARLMIHLARTAELEGDLEAAVASARRAITTRASDDRRLFLARLRLRRDEVDLAALGISRIRNQTAADRGRLLLGLHALSSDPGAARGALQAVSRDPWRAAAAVLLARLDVAAGDPEQALARLDGVADHLRPFWAQQARELAASLAESAVVAWRVRLRHDLDTATTSDHQLTVLARWATLEPDPRQLEAVRAESARLLGRPADAASAVPTGLARELWLTGLPDLAVRWDAGGLPADDADATLWSARQLAERGHHARALVLADRSRAQRSYQLPVRAHSRTLRRLLYPAPDPTALAEATADLGVDWTLVAAVAREESRFDASVVSAVGARGLMQLMPATAVGVATRLGLPPPEPDDLFDPATSLRLGASELDRLRTHFGGFVPAAVAAYNAGEDQARLWLDDCGPDCDSARYVATITFTATRTYTEDVLAATKTYRELDAEAVVVTPVSR